MKLIVGLGNPGAQYDKTRHNVGFMVADALAARHGAGQVPKSRFNAVTLDLMIGTHRALLMKPTTFMNLSGKSVGEAVRFFKLDPGQDLIVLVDDIALPVGHIRVRERGGSGGHNGLSDIDRVLGGEDYARVRLGVGAVPRLMNQADWVLSRFMAEEHADVDRAVAKGADATEVIVKDGVTRAMNEFNTRLAKPKPEPDKPGATSGARTDPAPEASSNESGIEKAGNENTSNENNTNQPAQQGRASDLET